MTDDAYLEQLEKGLEAYPREVDWYNAVCDLIKMVKARDAIMTDMLKEDSANYLAQRERLACLEIVEGFEDELRTGKRKLFGRPDDGNYLANVCLYVAMLIRERGPTDYQNLSPPEALREENRQLRQALQDFIKSQSTRPPEGYLSYENKWVTRFRRLISKEESPISDQQAVS